MFLSASLCFNTDSIPIKKLCNWLTNEKRGAYATLRQQKSYRQAVSTQLVATIANTYFSLLAIDEQLSISRQSLGAWDEIIRTLEVRKKVGEANEASVAQARASRHEVESSILSLSQQSRTMENSMCTLLGWTNNSGASIVNPGNWLLNALGALTQPIFNKGRNVANLKIAKAQQEEALIAFRQKLLDAGAEVNDALTQWQTAQQRLDVSRRQICALEEAVRSTRLLMTHSGNSSYLEVLTAQQSLLGAQLTETQETLDKIQGVIKLYHALGGGR